MRCATRVAAVLLVAGVWAAGPLAAATDSEKEIEKYREMLRDGNPGELWEMKGEQLFRQKRGPKNASLERCDFGLGPGKLDGAYAQLPRYFADSGRVEDLESRLLTCMTELQGFKREELQKTAFSNADRSSDIEALVTFIAAKSNGMKFSLPLAHPKEREAYRIGEEIFWRRSSLLDFSCQTCHGENGKRIRLQGLPKLTDPKQAGPVMGSWPTYRVSQGTVRTMQHRMWDCGWQMRLPDVEYASDLTVAIISFLTKNAEGGVINVPAIKR